MWKIIVTETFSREFKKYKKNQEFLNALDKKIQKLKIDPTIIGKYLSGKLHTNKSTRIVKKFRLIFKINKENNSVILFGVDHRKFNYENF